MMRKTLSQRYRYLSPSVKALSLETEEGLLNPSMTIPDVNEEDMGWLPVAPLNEMPIL